LDPAVSETQLPITADDTLPLELPAAIADSEAALDPAADDRHELEWWDFDETRTGQPDASLSDEVLAESWTPADPSQFQQDVSQMPEMVSLTTWGESDIDDDPDDFPPLDLDFDVPDPEGDNLSTWITIPEDAPMDVDELPVPPFVEDDCPEEDYSIEWNDLPSFQVVSTADIVESLPLAPASPRPFEYVERVDRFPAQQAGAQQVWDQLDVDVAVEMHPAPEMPAPAVPSPEMTVQTITHMIQPEPIPAHSLYALPPELPDAERDDKEMREIEMGIAKFRRVVQVNPRNAHAWDALGTLYKSAGLYKDAILAYQQAISNDSSRSLYYHHLGLVYACEGRDEDAIGAFQRVIEIDPEYSLAHATLGGYYRKLGLEELAQKHIGKAMKSIFDSENEYNKACLEAICGNTAHAIELLGVALKNKQTYVDWILRDPDLDFIRQDPRFKQLISDYTR
ncbi:MAG: tetratricopeptide repeat protein, partial [Anaerolineae bacterium]